METLKLIISIDEKNSDYRTPPAWTLGGSDDWEERRSASAGMGETKSVQMLTFVSITFLNLMTLTSMRPIIGD